MIKRLLPYSAPVFFGLFQWAGWPAGGFAPLLFLSWIFLFLTEDYFEAKKLSRWKLFGSIYLGFLIWNASTTWWIYNSTHEGSFFAIACNALFMASVFMVYHLIRLATGKLIGRFALIPLWLSFEYLHLNWDLSWPWLSLGNGMASYYHWIQWYEFTGMQGGSFWILWVNILIYQAITTTTRVNILPKTILAGLVLLLPVFGSLLIYNSHHDKGSPVNVLLVQPNIDPYHDKFNGTGDRQLENMLKLSESKLTDSVQLLIFPETALPDGIWENNLRDHRQIKRLLDFLSKYPNLSILTGATTLRFYTPDEPISKTARKHKLEEGYYDIYNTALLLTSGSDSIQVYHKSKLVPGVEKMPYPSLFGFLEKYAIDLGGMAGSHGIDKEPRVFKTKSGVLVAPVICYESIYGDYIRHYIEKGAELIGVITNDGWWGNTPGHKQHLAYARLAAISFRKCIARSANTGISCFINQRGDIIQPQPYWQKGITDKVVLVNQDQTYYARFGNTIAAASLILTVALLVLTLIKNRSSFIKKGIIS
ncbi:MAG: apolipoprotein N-acyltransferase [Bacteroidia bacterium]|nr:apolipoprotein N-acyltransferase [Bacteroidia bacterium]MCZ2278399.1 apolipoprotein N-acyltransferase [Bacteroidia bacterium]